MMIRARVKATHFYGFQPAGSIVEVDESELARHPAVLELAPDVPTAPEAPEAPPAAVEPELVIDDAPEPANDAPPTAEELEEELAGEAAEKREVHADKAAKPKKSHR